MEKPPAYPRSSWWARQSVLRKTLFLLVPLILILALALGLGLGLGLSNGSGGSGNGNGNGGGGSTPTSTSTPTTPATPPTNATLWQPAVNATWQIILQDAVQVSAANTTITPDVDVWDIDLFANTNTTIAALHALGKKVICYFSAGSSEDWRPDFDDFEDSDLGNDLDGWPGERWLNVSSPTVREVMAKRIEMAKEKGCDAIDPDNVDGYDNDNGLSLTLQDSINYIAYLSTTASNASLSTGLKNAGLALPHVLNLTHFSVNEQCVQYGECSTFTPFINADKPVFHIEYPSEMGASRKSEVCGDTGDADGSRGFSTVLKRMDLDGWVQLCDGVQVETPVVAVDDGDDDSDDDDDDD